MIPRYGLPNKEVLEKCGVEEVVTMHVNKTRFKNIQEFEKAVKEQFEDSIIAVFSTENGYYAEIFVLKDGISNYTKSYLKAFISLYALERHVHELGDPELIYLTEKAHKHTIDMLEKITNEVINSYKNLNEVYRELYKKLSD